MGRKALIRCGVLTGAPQRHQNFSAAGVHIQKPHLGSQIFFDNVTEILPINVGNGFFHFPLVDQSINIHASIPAWIIEILPDH